VHIPIRKKKQLCVLNAKNSERTTSCGRIETRKRVDILYDIPTWRLGSNLHATMQIRTQKRTKNENIAYKCRFKVFNKWLRSKDKDPDRDPIIALNSIG
jgi:ribosomal protein L40E